jgi:hypothetical protein
VGARVEVWTRSASGGVRFAVAVDDSVRGGPANGGVRVAPGLGLVQAGELAEQLAAEMAVKHAVHGTGFRGAKIVVAGDPARGPLWEAVAGELNAREGEVYTGCDMGVGDRDMRHLSELTPYVLSTLANPAPDICGTCSRCAADRCRPNGPDVVPGPGATCPDPDRGRRGAFPVARPPLGGGRISRRR